MPHTARGSKKGPPDNKDHMTFFNDALNAALDDADSKWGTARTNVTVTFEATVDTKSPGNIHEYRVILSPPGS